MSRPEKSAALIALIILVAALTLRLWDLGDRPFHHDESMHALYGYEIATQFKYRYVPFLHGPVLYYLNGVSYTLFGDSDFTARLMPAIAGTLLCGLPWLIRSSLGVSGALAAMLLLTLSPTFLYFSRFLRHDIYSELLHAVMLFSLLKITQRPERKWLVIFAGSLAASFANHELAYISIFLMTLYLGWFLIQKRRFQHLGPWLKLHRSALLAGLTCALVVYTLLFSSFFTNMRGLLDGLPNPFSKSTSLGYWLSQHGVKRGNQPWFYYLVLLTIYEFVAFFIFAWIVCRWKKFCPTPLTRFLLFWAVGSLVIYSWAGERMPWLTMHPLLPMILLAGRQIGHWIDGTMATGKAALAGSKKSGRFWSPLVKVSLTAAALLLSGFFSWRLNFKYAADPREPMVYVQSNPDVLGVVAEIQTFENTLKKTTDHKMAILIDNEITWPFPWYLRHIKRISYQDNLAGTFIERDLQQHDVLLMHLKQREDLPQLPEPWKFRGIHALRSWWVPDRLLYLPNQPGGLQRAWRWWLNREPREGEGDMIFAFFSRG